MSMKSDIIQKYKEIKEKTKIADTKLIPEYFSVGTGWNKEMIKTANEAIAEAREKAKMTRENMLENLDQDIMQYIITSIKTPISFQQAELILDHVRRYNWGGIEPEIEEIGEVCHLINQMSNNNQ